MAKKRVRIPQETKVRAYLQQEINSKCPFCKNKEVGHFEIHHIDEDPSNNDIANLLLLCSICHSKITKKDILKEEVNKVKKGLENRNAEIQFISVSVDSENCGWESYENTKNAFKITKYTSLFPIFNFSFINNSDKTILLTNIIITSRRMPVGLSGAYTPTPSILRPVIKYKIKLPPNNESTNTTLKEEVIIRPKEPVKFQVELFSDRMSTFDHPNKYALYFKFVFNSDFHIEAPMILLNSEEYYSELTFTGIN